MNNPRETPYSKIVVIHADGTQPAWFYDADDALLYVAGRTDGRLGVFVTTGVTELNAPVICIQLGE